MTPLARIIRRNFGYKALSVAIAVLLWIIANNNQENPRLSGEVYIQPQVVGLSPDYVVRVAPAGGMVGISGPTSAVTAYRNEPVRATVDVSHARVGPNQLPITYKTPPAVELGNAPETAEVTLERKVGKDYFVDVLTGNLTPPAGYEFGDPVPDPKRVTVAGLQEDVDRVARVVAIVQNAGQPTNGQIVQQVDLIAQTQEQQTVDAVEIDRPRVQVTIPLRRAGASKTLILSPAFEGSAAPGYAVTGYSFHPPTVTVAGPETDLESRSSLSVPITVTNVHGPVTRAVIVVPPSGMTLRTPSDGRVSVSVDVAPIAALSAGTPAPGPTSASLSPQPPPPAAGAPISTAPAAPAAAPTP